MTVTQIAKAYYGSSSFDVLIKSANPTLRPSGSWSSFLASGSVVTLPSILTCYDFLPVTCLNFARSKIISDNVPGLIINEDALTSQLNLHLAQTAKQVFLSSAAMTCMSGLQKVTNWGLAQNVSQMTFDSMIQSSTFSEGIQFLRDHEENYPVLRLSIFNSLDQVHLMVPVVYLSNGHGYTMLEPQTPTPPGSWANFTFMNDLKGGLGGVYGYVTFALEEKSWYQDKIQGNYLVIGFEIRNGQIYKNKMAITTLSLNGSDPDVFLANLFDTSYAFFDYTKSGVTMPLNSNKMAAQIIMRASKQAEYVVYLKPFTSNINDFYLVPRSFKLDKHTSSTPQLLQLMNGVLGLTSDTAAAGSSNYDQWDIVPVTNDWEVLVSSVKTFNEGRLCIIPNPDLNSSWKIVQSVYDPFLNTERQFWRRHWFNNAEFLLQSVFTGQCIQCPVSQAGPNFNQNPYNTPLACTLGPCNFNLDTNQNQVFQTPTL